MAQSVERRIGSAEVPGPIPGASFYRVQEMVEISRFLIFLCLFYDALKMSRMVHRTYIFAESIIQILFLVNYMI